MDIERARVYGYAVLINTFEPEVRKFLSNEVLVVGYGKNWMEGIPVGVMESAKSKAEIGEFADPIDLLDYTDFPHLKEIAIFKNNYSLCNSFFEGIPKERFVEIMDDLYRLRNRIAHVSRTFSLLDFDILLEHIKDLTKGSSADSIKEYIRIEKYRDFSKIPPGFLVEEDLADIISNLPPEDYNLEGGFVGRRKDKKKLIDLVYSDLDRVITVAGSGGVGKTALALNVAYSILDNPKCPFNSIVWFSAKTTKLTPKGIRETTPEIKNYEDFVRKTVSVLLPASNELPTSSVPLSELSLFLKKHLAANRTLLIIDNLESVMDDSALVEYLKDVPRPSKVLITSRRGLGEVERRSFLDELQANEAVLLFRLTCRDKGLSDYVKLSDDEIKSLVNQVQCYPLAIKWSLGKAALGKDLEEAFRLPLEGKSDIARFSFEDIFVMLSEKARTCLYGLSLFDEPPSATLLRYLMQYNDDVFEDAIQELVLASFVFIYNLESDDEGITTGYGILSLTQDYVREKLNKEQELRITLNDRYFRLRQMVEQEEKAISLRSHSVFTLGAKTTEDRIAVNMVKTAKGLYRDNKRDDAKEIFEEAVKIAPKLPYVLMEYAKFENQCRRIRNAEKLMKKAAELEPKNLHVWYHWGIIKRRQHRLKEAEDMFKKGLELDPNHPNLNIELGRVLTFLAEYSESNDTLKKVLDSSSIITTRQKLLTLNHLADNMRRWADSEIDRRNREQAIKFYQDSLTYIEQSLDLSPDRKSCDLWRKINLSYGIALSKIGRLDDGRLHLEKSIEPIDVGNIRLKPDREHEATVCFHIAIYEKKKTNPDLDEIDRFVTRGKAVVPPTSRYKKKFSNLSREISSGKNRLLGRIRFFNKFRGFGIIDSEDKVCIFFPEDFRNSAGILDSNVLEGSSVSYVAIRSKKFEGGWRAEDVRVIKN